eukprot:TRINITY_DN2716_c1_g1_i1.p1 TRINITY_DN2716_c1_g1~~TRINITY_DN2716_c1_g1_i1.p1  ORF type:complete len:227 (+),score=50.58 TRINITY_DN2716_c1_g1_i1:35-715(+)
MSFSIHHMNNTKPPTSGAFKERKATRSDFRLFYDRGDLPVIISHQGAHNRVHWKVPMEKLNYNHFLPIFFDGLRELEEPYKFLAREGTLHMLKNGNPTIVKECLPQLIIPIKKALNTRNKDIICSVLKILQELVKVGPEVGHDLVAFYRQILPIFNMFKNHNLNLGDGIEYSQYSKVNVGDLIEETLQMFEKYGGNEAYVNIKWIVPTYESIFFNRMPYQMNYEDQ